MSAIENVKPNLTPQLRETKSVTNGLDFSQFFNSEMLTSFNLNTLSDVAPPRQSQSNGSLEEARTSRNLGSDNGVKEDRFRNQSSTDDRDLRINDNDNADVDDHYRGQNPTEETDDGNLQSEDQSPKDVHEQPSPSKLTSAQPSDANPNPNPEHIKLNTGSVSEVTPKNNPEAVKEEAVTERSENIPLSVDKLITAPTENANANLQIQGIEHPTQEASILASASVIEGNSPAIKDTSPATILSQSKNTKELNQASVPIKGNSQKTPEINESPNTIPSEGALSDGVKKLNIQNNGEIPFGANSEKQANIIPQKQEPNQATTTTKASETVILNDGKSLPLELNPTKPVTPQTQGQNITATVNKPSLDARLDVSGSGQSQTEPEQTVNRTTTNANTQTKHETAGLKLSQLDKNIIVQTADSSISPRTTNTAGNNILQAQNSAQVNESTAVTPQRNGASQIFNLPQQQVQSNQSNSQTSGTTPLHVGANTGDNNANTNNQGAGNQSSNGASTPTNQINGVPVKDAVTFKLGETKSENLTTRSGASTPVKAASLGAQSTQPAVTNAPPTIGSNGLQSTNPIFSAQQTNLNSKPTNMAPATNQVSIQLSKAVQNGDNKIKIQLRPQELGRVEVKLEIANDGRAKALIIAERPETLDILQRDARVLDRALQDAGLKTDQNSLSFDLQSRDGNSDTQNATKDAGKENTNLKQAGENNEDSNPNLIPATAIGVTPDGEINLLA
jgi:flagellar hook-length control protein FliK